MQRVPGVQVALAVAHVLLREQHLRHPDAVRRAGLLVVPHERRLADRGGGLLLGDRARPFRRARAARCRRRSRPTSTRATSTPPAITCATLGAPGARSGPDRARSPGSAMSPLPTLTTTRRTRRRARQPAAPATRSRRRRRSAVPSAVAERRRALRPVARRDREHGQPPRRARRLSTRRGAAPRPRGRSCSRRSAAAARPARASTPRAPRWIVRQSSTGSRPGGRVEVEEVDQEPRPLEVAQEAEAEPLALRRARDQPGHVRDDEAPLLVEPDEPERRDERREGVVRDLRARGREARRPASTCPRSGSRRRRRRPGAGARAGASAPRRPRRARRGAARGAWRSRSARCRARRGRPARRRAARRAP